MYIRMKISSAKGSMSETERIQMSEAEGKDLSLLLLRVSWSLYSCNPQTNYSIEKNVR